MACRNFYHHYLVMRHGESTANVNHEMITDPRIDGPKYGLTALGRNQCEISGMKMKMYLEKCGCKLDDVYIYYSDFERTKQTALILFKCLFGENAMSSEKYLQHFTPSKALRARNYGDINGLSGTEMVQKYLQVSQKDKINPDHTLHNVESFNASMNRTKGFVEQMEEDATTNGDKKKVIIMVSHAMSSQTLQTWFQKSKSVPEPMKNGEFRDLSALLCTTSKL